MATTTNGGKGKPVAYELFPLSVLRGDDSDLFRPLTDEYINSILQFYEDLQEHEKTLNDEIEEWERRSHLQKLDAAIAKLREMKEEISAQSKTLTRNMDVITKLTEDLKFYSILTAALRRFHSFLSDKRVVLLPRGSCLETRLPRPDSGRDLRVLFTRFRPLEADPGLVAAFESEHGDFVKRRDGTGTSSAAAAAASTDFLIVDVELHPMHGSKDGTTKIFRCVVTKPPPLPKPLPSKSPPPSPSPSPKPSPLLKSPPPSPSPSPKPSPLLKSPPPSPSPFGRDKVLGLLRRNIADAVFHGRIRDGYATKPLGKFETEADIVEDKERPDLLSEKDHGFSLYAADSESRSNLRGRLVRKYFDRKSEGIGTPAWCSAFRRHVEAIVQRRLSRVREWIRINTEAFRNDSAVATLLSNAEVDHFIPLRQFWTICEQKCQQCDRLCLKRSQHDEEHDCYTNHKCEHRCSYCSDSDAGRVYVCRHCGGHSGPHRCSENEHLCESACDLAAQRGCLGTCSRDVAHVLDAADRLHRCKAKVHYCIERCDFLECSLDCSKSYDHDGGHECSGSHCPMFCSMDLCSNRCSCGDEPHSFHICKESHACSGSEEDWTYGKRGKLDTFDGLFGTFSYRENATKRLQQRKRCAISIPPGQRYHQGFSCKTTLDAPLCTSQCPTCESTCVLDLHHKGFHRIEHSNMINQVFVSESTVFGVGERKYGPGESARAEICDDFCRRLGRGHTHVIRCQGDHGDHDPRLRHDVRTQYADVVFDEVTHDYYWEYCQIEDNCSESERELFRMCNHYCDDVEATPDLRTDDDAFCQLELWHEPLQSAPPDGQISTGGHYFFK